MISLLPVFLFGLKLVLVAGLVVAAAAVAERSRPAMAALIATLPLSVGPAYLILALDHDAAFLTAATLKSSASVVSTMVFIAIYANAMMRFGVIAAISIAYLAWLPVVLFVHAHAWSMPEVAAFLGIVTAGCLVAMRRLKHFRPTAPVARRWWDIPVRAAGVAAVVGLVTGFSEALGPAGAGTLANFPIVMSSVSVITHARMGGPVAAAMLANSTWGMVGASVALAIAHLTMPTLGVAGALVLALLASIGLNLALFLRGRA